MRLIHYVQHGGNNDDEIVKEELLFNTPENRHKVSSMLAVMPCARLHLIDVAYIDVTITNTERAEDLG